MSGLADKIAKGAVWMVGAKLAERSLGFISTIILARLLIPADFGLVSLAATFVAGTELLTAFGFDTVLIQKQQAVRRHYDTAWTFNVVFGLSAATILILLAIPASHFFAEPRLEHILYVLACSSVIQGFENIGIVDFRKHLQFHREFHLLFSRKLAAFAVTVGMAFTLRDYWALVIGILTSKFVGLALSYRLHPYRPRFSLEARHELLHFSQWLVVTNALYYVRTHGVDFVIGRLVGPGALGIFRIAEEIATLPTTELIQPINRAVFPGLANMARDRSLLRQGFVDVMSMMALFTFPAAGGIAITAPLLVPVFLGEKWLSAIPLVEVLAIYGGVIAMISNTGYVLYALGKPERVTWLNIANLIILLPALIWATSEYGTAGSAWAYLLAALTMAPLFYGAILRQLGLPFVQLLAAIWRPAAATAVMLASVATYLDLSEGSLELADQLVRLSVAVATGVMCYAFILLGLWRLCGKPRGAERFLLDRLASLAASTSLPKALRR